MPSRTSTVVLGLLAILFGTLAAIQFSQNDLSSIFGAPARPEGEVLFEYELDEVHSVTITNSADEQAVFSKQNGAWVMTKPLFDRADYRDLQRIVYFSRLLRVEDALDRDEITLEAAGLREVGVNPGSFRVDLEDKQGREVASYRLGRRTAWHHLDEESGKTSETFFVQFSEESQGRHIYVCSTPDQLRPSVRQLLDRGFARLRDHRPFLFDPASLADLVIRYKGSEIVLSREDPLKPSFRMTKPIESRTKPEAIAQLLQGLYDLEALKVHRKGSVTIPPRPNGAPLLEVALRLFDVTGKPMKRQIILTVEPPATPNANTVYAEVNNRPGTVLELPLGATKNRIALSELPFAVDDLRSKTLSFLNIAALDSITLHDQKLSSPIQVYLGADQRSGQRRWMRRVPGAPGERANEEAVANLLKAVSRDEIVGFASDAATDLTPFGLAPPQKRLVLQGGNAEALDLWFGSDQNGKFYAMRQGSSTVTEIGAGTYAAIATTPHEWRDTVLMPFSVVDLLSMRIERRIKPPLADSAVTLDYDFLTETWTATQFGEDATPRLNTQKANKFIRFMEELRVESWLGPDFPHAEQALRDPVYRFNAAFQLLDDEGDQAGVRQVSFEIARATTSRFNKYYYGRLSSDPNYFRLDRAAASRLADSLLEDE